jgi:hypothetical protein
MTLRCLLAGLGAWGLAPALAVLLYGRVGRTLCRIERMLVQFRAGRLLRRVGPREACSGRLERRTPSARLPRRFGWLVIMAGSEAACFGLQLQSVLNAPEMVELLASSPQAVRILAPLCRALAVQWPIVPKAEKPQRTPRSRKPRVKPEPFRIPLPRGVLTAARRQGFGKMC